MKKTTLIALLAGITLTACMPLSAKHYRSPGQPESLLDRSSENVSFGLKSKNFRQELASWLDKEQPTRAIVACDDATKECSQSKKMLHSFGVPFEVVAPGKKGEAVTLVYDRLSTRKCKNQFLSNHHNLRNLNHPAFGCSVATNSLLMINDIEQLITPSLSAMPDAGKAVSHVEKYQGK